MFSWVTLYIWREEIVNRVLDNCCKIYAPGMNFGYVTENGVNSNVIDRFLYC